jgi:hypothetical protein
MSPEKAAEIEAVAELAIKFGDVVNFDDIPVSLLALADTAAVLINDAKDPETVRNLFIAGLDQSLDLLTFMPQELSR